MPRRIPIPPPLLALAKAQAGAVTMAQCRAAGLPRTGVARLVAEGLWAKAGRGLYVTHCLAWGAATRQWLALLAAGDGAALGFETAAALQGWQPSTDAVHVVVPHARRVVQWGPWQVHSSRIAFATRGDPPCTSVERTALDMVRAEPYRAASVLADVVNSRRTNPTRILKELEKFEQFPRREVARGILGDVGEGALSVLEMMWLRDVERAHGLPRGERQTRSRAGYRDIRYGRLVVELDGRMGHTGSRGFRDMDRDNLHVLQGETTMRFGFHDTDTRPCACAAMVTAALRMLGHPVDWRSCRRGCVESEALLDRT
ncbi:type IV toxin-antitoxin system AbiEi family antitoxin domain-containing protein [Luteococcus sp. OSA5]|uniref:type IV toxin-antitoxin system AbiEi family antitoxin domain-containing protein n=1 Tax=Luteococcus sp. OSA5 TaxID=3401630 RepID=UPI003B437E99